LEEGNGTPYDLRQRSHCQRSHWHGDRCAKSAAKITVNFSDARKGTIVLDVNETEISDLISRGIRQARRGRKPRPLTGA
jgi:hypothetical protein